MEELLSQTTFGDAEGEILLSKGAQTLIEQTLARMPQHVRDETVALMPFLLKMRQVEGRHESSYSYSNAQLAVAYKNFQRAHAHGGLSRALFDQLDAWALALAGMARAKWSRRNDVNPLEYVSTPVRFVPKRDV